MLESPPPIPAGRPDQTMRDSIACFLFRFRYGLCQMLPGPMCSTSPKRSRMGRLPRLHIASECRQKTLLSGPLAQLQADLIAARKERDEATRLLRVSERGDRTGRIPVW